MQSYEEIESEVLAEVGKALIDKREEVTAPQKLDFEQLATDAKAVSEGLDGLLVAATIARSDNAEAYEYLIRGIEMIEEGLGLVNADITAVAEINEEENAMEFETYDLNKMISMGYIIGPQAPAAS